MLVVKNSLWNILAVILPTMIAIPSLGVIARVLGVELFGVFTLIFALIGYANIFDMGLSRGVVRLISLERNCLSTVKVTLYTASLTVFFMGCVACFIVYFFSGELTVLLKVSDEYQLEVILCLKLISFVLPLFLVNLVWLSYLEGMERFKELSIIRVVGSSLLSLFPLVGVIISPSIFNAVGGVFCARIIALIIIVIYTRKEIDSVFAPLFEYEKFRRLLSFGGWITVSNVISPIMSYFDRFILSSIAGASQVALYTAPADVVSKALTVPMAISKALFPRLVVDGENNSLKNNSLLAIFFIAIFIALPMFVFSERFLYIWLGDGYGGASPILRILLIGFVFNSLAQVPYATIQAKGFSKITAKIHLFELGPYLFFLFILIDNYSKIGVAIAWSLRVFFDFFILEFLSRRLR